MVAITPNRRIYVAGQDRAFTREDIVWFLRKQCSRYRKLDIIVIWDGAAIHRSEVIKAFLSERPGRIHLERLHAYSPQLNSVELLWSYLKGRFKNKAFTNLEELTAALLT